MRAVPGFLSILAVLATVLSSGSCDRRASFRPAAGGSAAPHGAAEVWSCPMCPSVSMSTAGQCPRCGMALIAAPTERVLACPLHGIPPSPESGPAAGSKESSGDASVCALCGRPRVAVTMTRAWRCPAHPAARRPGAGACPRCGQPLEARLEPLPHGDHNPRHGGILFMAPDQFHHLEGAWPSPRSFRLYLYDDFTRPIPAASLKARAVVGEGEETAVELKPAKGGQWLEGDLGTERSPPLLLTAWIRFETKEERFDFVFQGLSVEGSGRAPPLVNAGLAAAAGAPPDSLEGIAAEILARDLRLRALIAEGAWTRVYLPALEAKELALSLEERALALEEGRGGWDRDRRAALGRAVRSLVRAAWLLDLAGDRGDGPAVRKEYAHFEEGITALRQLFPPPAR